MYIKLTNGVPETYTIGKLRKDNPNVSFPKQIPESTLAQYDVYPYTVSGTPNYNPDTHKLDDGSFQNINGAWVFVVSAVELTESEKVERAEQRLQAATDAIQEHLDAVAQERRYDNIVSACSYAGHPNPYQAEGQAAIEWRGAVWAYATNVWAEVALGTRIEPTVEQLISELPTINWPA